VFFWENFDSAYIILKSSVRTSLFYRDKFERAYFLATESFYKIQARASRSVFFSGRILSLHTSFYKVQFGLVCGTGRTLSMHTYLPQSHSIKYRQGQSQCTLGDF
jgi:hypothetical protein